MSIKEYENEIIDDFIREDMVKQVTLRYGKNTMPEPYKPRRYDIELTINLSPAHYDTHERFEESIGVLQKLARKIVEDWILSDLAEDVNDRI